MNTKSAGKRLHKKLQPRLKVVNAAIMLALTAQTAQANPTGGTVVSGSASFATTGNTLTITNTPGTIINWQGFSIGSAEVTRFAQQSASSAVLNRVVGNNPSSILGTLQSNGRVFLINPNGIVFGAGATVDVAGLVASTLKLSNEDFLAGRYHFTEVPGEQNISNAGNVAAAGDGQSGGQIYLIAPDVENTGVITAPNGEILLAAGHSVDLVNTNSPNVFVNITAPAGNATNVGQLIASSGRLGLYGVVVRNSGIVSADSAVMEGGKIVFKASQRTEISGTVTANGATGGTIQVLGNEVGIMDGAAISANGAQNGGTILVGGDYQGSNPDVQNAQVTYVAPTANISADATDAGNGGKVIVWADDTTRFYGNVSARGGNNGGNGGFVETSGHNYLDFRGQVDARAPRGMAGSLLLDPADITINNTGPDNLAGGTLAGGWFSGATGNSTLTWATINTQLGLGNLEIRTNSAGTGGFGDINITGGGTLTATNSLMLLANRNITFANGISVVASGDVGLIAGWNNSGWAVTGGTGNIAFGTSTYSTSGNLWASAGNSITQLAGSSITANTLTISGDANGGPKLPGGVNLAGTNMVNTLAADLAITGGGSLTFSNAQALTIGTGVNGISGIDATGNTSSINITTSAGGITVNQSISSAGPVSLTAAGDISTSATGAILMASTVPTALTLTSSGNISIAGNITGSGAAGALTVVLDHGAAGSASLSVGAMLNGGKLDVRKAGVAAAGTLNMTGGQLANATLIASTLTGLGVLNSVVLGDATHQTLNASGGLFSVGNGLKLADGMTLTSNGTDWQVYGIGTQNIGTVTANAGATINLAGGGIYAYDDFANAQTLDINAGITVRGYGILGQVYCCRDSIVNHGVIDANVSGQTLTINPTTFTNAGTVDVTGGTLDIAANSWSNIGSINVSAGTLNLGGNFSTAGIGVIARTGGNINLTGVLDNTGTTLDIGSAGVFGTGGLTSIRNDTGSGGTILGGTIISSDSTALNSYTGGTWIPTLESVVLGDATHPTLNTSGDFNVFGGLKLADGMTLNSGGSRWYIIGIGVQNVGTVTPSAGATINLAGGLINGYTASQTLDINAGVVVRGYGNVVQSGGGGSIINHGLIDANVAGQTLGIYSTTTFANLGTVSGSGTIYVGAGTLTNTGTINVGALAAGTSGALDMAGGSLTVSGATNVSGAMSVSGGAVSLNGASSIGTLNMTGGTLGGAGAVSANTFNWKGGTLTGAGAFTVNTALNMPAGATSNAWNYTFLDGKVLNNYGVATLGSNQDAGGNGADLRLLNGAIVNNYSTWNINYANITNGAGINTFNNVGVLNVGQLGFGGSIYTQLVNTGAVNVIGEGLTLQNDLSGSGTVNSAATTTIFANGTDFSAGTLTLAGALQGTANVTIADLALASTGSITTTGGLTVTNSYADAGGALGNSFSNVGITQATGDLAIGSIGAAGTINLTSAAGALTINGSIAGQKINGYGASGVTLATTANLTATDTTTAVVLDAGAGNFVNNAGATAITNTGGGRWLIYSTDPALDAFGGLDSANLAIWGKTYATYAPGSVVETGNRYIFSLAPTLTATVNGGNIVKTYGADLTATPPTVTITGLVDAAAYGSVFTQDSWAGTGAAISSGFTANAPVSGGPYVVTTDVIAPAGYGMIFNNVTLTVNPAILTVTALDAAKTYDGFAYFGGNGVTYSGFVNGETSAVLGGSLTYGGTSQGAINAGSYLITPGGYTSANYAITYVNGALTIVPAPLTLLSIAANNATKTYGTSLTFNGTEFTPVGLIGGDTISGVTLTSAGAVNTANAGAYAITPSNAVFSVGSAANYNITYVDGQLTVTPAPLSVTANAFSKIYGNADPALTYSATGLLFSDTLTGGLIRTSGENVGAYAIGQGTLSNPNYSITYTGSNLSVTARPITVAANPVSKIYGDADPALSYVVGGMGLASWDTNATAFTGNLVRAPGENVASSPYAITRGSLAASNYTITFTGNAFTITPAVLSVYANPASKVVSTSDPLLTYTVQGLKLSDTGATVLNGGSLVRNPGEVIGNYQINRGSLALTSTNYMLNYYPASFSIVAPTVVNQITNVTLSLGTPDTGSAQSTSSDEDNKPNTEVVVAASSTADSGATAQALPVCQ